jgi:hypothetical protein
MVGVMLTVELESIPVVNVGDMIAWPGSRGWYAALEDSVPDPRGTGRVILRLLTPDRYAERRRVLTVCPPRTAEVKRSPSLRVGGRGGLPPQPGSADGRRPRRLVTAAPLCAPRTP